jgi:hypothetical protein
MFLTAISSDRHYQTSASYQIVYEWEDELTNLLSVSVIKSPYKNDYTRILGKFFRRVLKNDFTNIFDKKKTETFLYFEMFPRLFKSFSNSRNVVPIIIDFFDKENVESFNFYYRKCPSVLVSSLEVIQFLKDNDCTLNLVHFPLSLPDKYRLNRQDKFEKKIDVVLAGRRNPILWEYLKNYEIDNPNIEYVYQEQIDGKLFYKSNKSGVLGCYDKREDYWELLKTAKVAFYATPGVDGGEKRTRGFNPVTPRFLELVAAGCHIISRYKKNAESDFYNLDSICPNVYSYGDFVKQMDFALNTIEQPLKRNSDYLLNHYTSSRTKLLKKILINKLYENI